MSADENGRTHIFTERVMRKLRGENERRGVSYASIGAGVAIVSVMLGLGALAMDAGAQKNKIENLEKRSVETRDIIKDNSKEIKADLKETKDNVQLILQKLTAMEAVQRAERRREREQ